MSTTITTAAELRTAHAELAAAGAEAEAAATAATKAFSDAVAGSASPDDAARAEVAARVATARAKGAADRWRAVSSEAFLIVRRRADEISDVEALGGELTAAALRVSGIDPAAAEAIGISLDGAGSNLPAAREIAKLADTIRTARTWTGDATAALAALDQLDETETRARSLAKRLAKASKISDLR